MNNVICTFYENEIKYINIWCKYHLNIGFDNIYIYVFKDESKNYIENILELKIKSKIHIINIKDAKIQPKDLYISFYHKFKFSFKWCAYINMNEFIVLEKWNNLNQFFNFYKNISFISLIKYEYIRNKSIKKLLSHLVYKYNIN